LQVNYYVCFTTIPQYTLSIRLPDALGTNVGL